MIFVNNNKWHPQQITQFKPEYFGKPFFTKFYRVFSNRLGVNFWVQLFPLFPIFHFTRKQKVAKQEKNGKNIFPLMGFQLRT